ncbi:MAG: hypothetical protein K6G45_03550 [Lachnospiraceae bacterium]|nr:hypothetical protein [Lachnospiraceae bacterium]
MNIVKKIGKTVFETAQDFSGKDLVGRWYEDGCRHCEDLETYYEEKYPYMDLAGNWFPVDDRSGKRYFQITAGAHWSDIRNHMALEVGVLEAAGKGKFTSEGGTWGEIITFEIRGDSELYGETIFYQLP